MSDHEWAQEHIAAGIAAGLTADEADRLNAHLGVCEECAAAMIAAQDLDRDLGALFAGVRPGPMLEERTVHALRKSTLQRRRQSNWRWKVGISIAASIGLGGIGAAMSQWGEFDGLPFPGAERRATPQAVASAEGKPIEPDGNMRLVVPAGQVNDFITAEGLAQHYGEKSVRELERLNDPVGNAEGEQRTRDGDSFKSELDVKGNARAYQYAIPPLRPTATGAVNLGDVATNPNTSGGAMAGAVPSSPAPGQQAWGFANGATPATRGDLATNLYRRDEALGYKFFNPAEQKPKADPQNPVMFIQNGREETRVHAIQDGAGVGKDGTWAAKELNKAGAAVHKPDASGHVDTIGTATDNVTRYVTANQPPANPIVIDINKALQNPQANAAPAQKIIIRTGDIEFEVTSFDAAVATVTKLVTGINGAFIATVNSDKLPNGKVRGSVVVRVPPDKLDSLVLDLRAELGKTGELKRQKIGSQDITKQYTDLEGRLKAARTMEGRLLQMIKDGKGEIKQLLEAEKELGVWRTKIEEFEGELRYYGNLVSLSTLTISMAEKEIRAAAELRESERVQAGIEVEDVDTARQQAMTAIAEAKGRVIKSELKQLAAGQFNAALQFEVPPDAAGPIRDRLKQLGRMARLEIDRVQQAEGGPVPRDAKVVRGDAQFTVQIYNLANVAPRETATLQLAVPEVPAAYQTLREAIAKANGRVITARLDEQDRQNVAAQLDFEVRRADDPAIRTALAAAGESLARNVTRAVEGDNLTDAKLLYRVTLINAGRLRPRETVVLALEVNDVDAAMAKFSTIVADAKGQTVDAQVAHERGGRVTARLLYDVPLAAAPAVMERLSAAGTVRVHKSTRDPQAPDGKYATARLDLTVSNVDLIVAKDDGVWPQVRRGLSYSASVLLMSLTWVVFGLCVVLPWAVIGFLGYRLLRKLFPPKPEAATASAT